MLTALAHAIQRGHGCIAHSRVFGSPGKGHQSGQFVLAGQRFQGLKGRDTNLCMRCARLSQQRVLGTGHMAQVQQADQLNACLCVYRRRQGL